jgi:adenosylmethionine-8-amino-7-oxononanoate aminotransferase
MAMVVQRRLNSGNENKGLEIRKGYHGRKTTGEISANEKKKEIERDDQTDGWMGGID